jgi:hypothetical protein
MRDKPLSVVELAPVVPTASDDGLAERQIAIARDRHRTMLYFSLFIIAASFLLRRGESETITLAWPKIELPPLCASRALFDIECPGCGLTRSFVALAAGDIQESWHLHRLGWLLALAVVGQIPYRLYALRQLRKTGCAVQSVWPKVFGNFLIAMLILNWLLKIGGL